MSRVVDRPEPESSVVLSNDLALKGVAYEAGGQPGGNLKVGRFIAVDVLIVNDVVSVTKRSRFEQPVRCELGRACELTISARKRLMMFQVTLVGNGNTCEVLLNSAAANALQLAVWGHHSEARTSQDASLVAQAVERFTKLLGAARVESTDKERVPGRRHPLRQ
jgi:hypothetical protein